VTEPCSWIVELPQGAGQLLTANQRLHHMAVYSRRQEIIGSVVTLCRAQKIPSLERVQIIYVLRVPDRRRRDPENWAPSVKAAIDGLVVAKVIPDDSWAHVDGPHPAVILIRGQRLSLALVIREVP
jgi:crossover junction endodeoxyribonuclease RusA